MSDGPYRSLLMRPAWKQMCKRAHEPAFDKQDIAESLCPALVNDWRIEVPADFMKAVREICSNDQNSMFDESAAAKLENLRSTAFAAGTIGSTLIDHLQQALSSGQRGDEALLSSTNNTLIDVAMSSIRSMEEHYLREAPGKAPFIRKRAEAGIEMARGAVSDLAEKIVRNLPFGKMAPPKHDGLEDGVPL